MRRKRRRRWRRRRSMSRLRGLVNFITCDPGWQSQWIIAREPSANSSLTNTLQILYKYTNNLQIFYKDTNTLQTHTNRQTPTHTILAQPGMFASPCLHQVFTCARPSTSREHQLHRNPTKIGPESGVLHFCSGEYTITHNMGWYRYVRIFL